MQVKPIKRKILTTSESGVKTTTIARNPAAQKYSFNRIARCTKMIAPRQIAKSTRGSKLAAQHANSEATSRTGMETHLMIFVTIRNIVSPSPQHPNAAQLASPARFLSAALYLKHSGVHPYRIRVNHMCLRSRPAETEVIGPGN